MNEVQDLTIEQLEFLKESVRYSIRSFEDYQYYPTPEYKEKRIDDARTVLVILTEGIAIKKKHGKTKH